MLKSGKRLTMAAAIVGLACVAGGVLNAARPSPTIEIHVQDVYVDVTSSGKFASRAYYATGFVQIVDEFGVPVRRATVTGDFTGCTVRYGVVARTDADGWAVLKADLTCSCVQTFTVTKVAKDGAWYDESANVATSDSWCLCGDCGS